MTDVSSKDELAVLKKRADTLGVSYHPSVGLEKLKARVALAIEKGPQAVNNEEKDVPMNTMTEEGLKNVDLPNETQQERFNRLRKEAGKLIRVRITNMNPDKRNHPGNYHAAGNSVVGTFKKYIPYQSNEPYHIPNIIYKQLLETEFQAFSPKVMPNGDRVNVGRLVKEFSIEVLPALSSVELQKLGETQAKNRSID